MTRDVVIQISPDEIIGQIRATQSALIELASHMGTMDRLRNRIVSLDQSAWENGLVSKEDGSVVVTKEDLPLFFGGMRDAYEWMLNSIDARTPPSNQLGLEFSGYDEEPTSVTVTVSHP